MAKLRLRIQVRGNFAVHTTDGQEVTPRSKKAVGVLALLAECDTMVRGRRWLEDKLWSDRGPDQARGSLRTTLSEIRKALGPDAGVLGSDRNSVWLEKTAIETDLAQPKPRRELLEGIDIPDPNFQEWLTERRQIHDPSHKPTPPRQPVPQDRTMDLQDSDPMLAPEVKAQICKMVSDFLAHARQSHRVASSDVIISTSRPTVPGGTAILVQVLDPTLPRQNTTTSRLAGAEISRIRVSARAARASR